MTTSVRCINGCKNLGLRFSQEAALRVKVAFAILHSLCLFLHSSTNYMHANVSTALVQDLEHSAMCGSVSRPAHYVITSQRTYLFLRVLDILGSLPLPHALMVQAPAD